MLILQAGFAENFVGDSIDDLLLVVELLHAADQRDHDFGNDLDALLGNLHDGFEDGARLHLGDLGIGDTQTAAAMSEHRVELVQLFHAMQQFGQLLLQIARPECCKSADISFFILASA